MNCANGVHKAGTFKDNVLVKHIEDPEEIEKLWDKSQGSIPEDFHRQLTSFVDSLNPKEDQRPFLKKVLKNNQQEDVTLKNKL
jgi:hypothetical protein